MIQIKIKNRMRPFIKNIPLIMLTFIIFIGCNDNGVKLSENSQRSDNAYKVDISQNGSFQNPTWSPDGKSLLYTRFWNGYNEEPADLMIIDLEKNKVKTLVSDGSGNINLPGSSWNARTNTIVFSSSRNPHDEIYIIKDNGNPGDEKKITNRLNKVAYEPSISPDGQWIVFESHLLDEEGEGIIVKYKVDGSESYQELTEPNDDCRQPNWSPTGDLILYQKLSPEQWDIWVMNEEGENHRKVTTGTGDKTDASFSPDGQCIVYSSDEEDIDFANLFIIPVSGGNAIKISNYSGYDGAPSWSPDGNRIAFESSKADPDGSTGTTIWVINIPDYL